MEVVFSISLILITGYFFGLIAEKINLPRVSAYLIAGVLFSQEFLGHYINLQMESWSELLSSICLGVIAYIIGSEIKFKNLIKHEKLIIFGTLGESILATVFVYLLFLLMGNFILIPKYLPAILASIAATTAPAATIAIIDQYKSKGEVTDTLLGIVALDDALGILTFTLVVNLTFGQSWVVGISSFAIEILLSIILGVFLGFVLSKSSKFSISNDYLLPLLLGLVFLSVYLEFKFEVSNLLICLMMGLTANNINNNHQKVSLLLPIQHIEELIFITFFTLAGSHFSFQYFKSGIVFIIIYIIARSLGKYIGVYIGTIGIKKNNPKLSKYIGFSLLPQAGVAIGLVLQVIHQPELAGVKHIIFNTVLGSTIIYELFGPMLTKYSLKKVGDIK